MAAWKKEEKDAPRHILRREERSNKNIVEKLSSYREAWNLRSDTNKPLLVDEAKESCTSTRRVEICVAPIIGMQCMRHIVLPLL